MSDVSEHQVRWRDARPSDVHFLRQALESEAWLEAILGEYHLLIEGWGRAGDGGVIGFIDGQLAGAAWYRMFEHAPGELGFLTPDTPLLANAWVVHDLRGQGYGTAMLDRLLRLCRLAGHRRISVATDQSNPALRLYWRLGFITESVVGTHWRLIKTLE